MSEIIVAKKYARALYGITEEKGFSEEVKNALQEVNQLLEQEGLIDYMVHPLVELEDKRKIVRLFMENIELEEEASVTLERFLHLLIDKKRFSLINRIYDEFEKFYHHDRNIQLVEVITPGGLTETQKERVISTMEEFTGKQILIEEKHDPGMVAGIKIIMGTKVLDGSVSAQLERLASTLQATAG